MAAPGGRGRGGRGAAILEALQRLQQRPGETAPIPSVPGAAQPTPLVTSATQFAAPTPSAMPVPSVVATRVEPVVSEAASASGRFEPGGVQPPGVAESAPRPMARGRGARIAHLLDLRSSETLAAKQQQPSLPAVTPEPPPAQVASSIATPSSLPSIRRSLPSTSSAASAVSSQEPPVKQMQEIEISRPFMEKGTDGRPVFLAINHIPIRIREGKGMFEYAVMFDPVVENKSFRFKLMSQQREVLGKTRTFDGAKLYLPYKLENDLTVLDAKHPINEANIKITIKFITKQELGNCIHHFNVLFRRVMGAMNLVQIGRNMFDPKGSVSIERYELDLWPGFVTAIQEFEGGLMLLAEVSHRVLRSQTVLKLMSKITDEFSTRYREECAKQILGSVILTRYNNMTYRVDDILWDSNPTKTFKTTAGNEISYVDYYKNSYDITIEDLGQPLLLHLVKSKQPGVTEKRALCTIPELCYLTGLTDEMRSNFHVMKDIASHTRIAPVQRRQTLIRFIQNVNACEKAKEILDGWGVEILPSFTETTGRQMRREAIIFGSGVKIESNKEADWGRESTSNRVITGINLEKYVVLYCRRDEGRVRNFVSMLVKVAPQLGIMANQPRMILLRDDRNDSLMNALREVISSEVQIVIVVNPTSRDDRYNLIKKVCCVDMPVPSQVINGKTIEHQQKLRSVTQKIALQINCKLGGELWAVEIPLSKLMVVGIDVYHDATKGKQSVLGFVFSVNASLTRWSCQSCFQTAGHDFGDKLKSFMMFALKIFYQVNHFMPEKIIIFRDGVSDGQLDFVANYEIKQIMSAFELVDGGYNPTLTVIIVQKRINTRMFTSMGPRDLANPMPGTVLDHTVTRRDWTDFFLVSQHVRQGTVSPTHYIILFNNNSKLTADHIQRISYKMTHLYYNWPGTVRVPAPCQYAHRLAAQVGQNIHAEPNAKLCDRLFFL